MADGKIDALDVGALERSVNDSATRVSAIWLSFVAFTAYLAAAASNISHRQIFLEEPIKLPTINIDLPLVASGILLPLLFVIYHVYVLLQVVLLARTAAAYNEAMEHAVPDATDSTRVRQRLANTLFAQLFAGSSREREGVLGWLLRGMAWITLAIAPVLVLILFEVRFLPYHSAVVTWTHRGMITLDLIAVLMLWSAAVRPARDITWRSSAEGWRFITGALVILLLCVSITFPGEPTRNLMRMLGQIGSSHPDSSVCWSPPYLSLLYADRLALQGVDFIDDEKIDRLIATARSNGQRPHESARSRSFRGRDLRCGQFAGTDLRRADFSAADLSGASFKGAHLGGAIFSAARLQQAVLDGAQLQDSYFSAEESEAKDSGELLKPADLSGASLRDAQLQGASLRGVALPAARLDGAQMHGADLEGADLRAVSLSRARLHGATLKSARLQGAMMVTTDAPGASFDEAQLQVAAIGSSDLRGAEFSRSMLQGTRFNSSHLMLANFSSALLWRATGAHCVEARVSDPKLDPVLEFEHRGRHRGRGGHTVPVGPDAEGLEKFLGHAVEGLPPAVAEQLRARLTERLALDARNIPPGQADEWRACAETSAGQDEEAYKAQRAVELARLVCNSGSNGGYIAAGLYRTMWRLMGVKSAPTFVRAIIAPDGKPCAGASDMEPRLRADLLAAVKE